MTQDADSFFTLDHGTASTAVALVSPVEGRYRLLGAATVPAGVEVEPLLEDLVWRVARADAGLLGSIDGWQQWSRLEVRTIAPPRVCLVAASAASGELLERAFWAAGWHVAARSFDPRPDPIALGEACLDSGVSAVAVGLGGLPPEEEREHARRLWPLVGSVARMRDDLAVIACGPLTDRPEGIPEERLFALPAAEPVPATTESALRRAAGQVAAHLGSRDGEAFIDGRASLRRSIVSLAVLLGGRVEGIEVGAAAGSRTLAHPDGELRHAIIAAGESLPRAVLSGDEGAEAVLRWYTGPGDPSANLDRLRELALHPWSAVDRTAAHLRLAALRAALERMQQGWDAAHVEGGGGDADAADVVVLSGGAFAAVPSAASALALVDSVRRPGAATILHDHARILAPLGALPVEGDRRRLLADLVDDCLLPVGSSLVTGSLGDHGNAGVMSVTTSLGAEELRLDPERLSLVDLPPGIVARLDIDPHDATVLGVHGQRLTLEVSGGLAGLLVDTRAIPLRLPETEDARRGVLQAWERPAWLDAER